MITLVGASHSDVGRVRAVNQDGAVADGDLALFAVADGMGGHQGGEVASALALASLVAQAPGGGGLSSAEALVEAVLVANERVYDEGRRNAELHGMGTTMCVVALLGGAVPARLAVANVGDSRVYVLRNGEFAQLTEDHSLVQSLVRQGQLSAEEAAVHPLRNVVTRVIGVEPDVEVDWWERPAIAGERYLLCSDGLFNEVSDTRIAAVLRALADPDDAVRELVRLANDAGGRDNITCVVVDVVDDGTPAAPDPGPTAAAGLAAELAEEVAGELAEGSSPIPAPVVVPRVLNARVVAFVGVLGLLLATAYFAIRYWAARSYFVGFGPDERTVVIYQGRPDGVLWFDPDLVESTVVRREALTDAQIEQLEQHPYLADSLDEARDWVGLLIEANAISQSQAAVAATPTPGAVPIRPTPGG